MTPIEAMAQAICREESYPEESWRAFIPAARAALEALMEPSYRMKQAMTMVVPTWEDSISRAKWQAGIKAALEEGP